MQPLGDRDGVRPERYEITKNEYVINRATASHVSQNGIQGVDVPVDVRKNGYPHASPYLGEAALGRNA